MHINKSCLKETLYEKGFSQPIELPTRVTQLLIEFAKTLTQRRLVEWFPNALVRPTDSDHERYLEYWAQAGRPFSPREPEKYCREKPMYEVLKDTFFYEISKDYFNTQDIWVSNAQNYRPKGQYSSHISLPWHADRHGWKENALREEPQFDFLVFWISLSNELESMGGGLEILPITYVNGKDITTSEENQLCYPVGFDSQAKHPGMVLSPYINECVVFTSSTYHRSVPFLNNSKTLWTFDLRFESGRNLSEKSKKYGFPLVDPISYESWCNQLNN